MSRHGNGPRPRGKHRVETPTRSPGLLPLVRLSNPAPLHETLLPSEKISSLLCPHNPPAVLRECPPSDGPVPAQQLTLWSSSEPLIQMPSTIGEDLSVDRRSRYVSALFPPTLSPSLNLSPSVHVSSSHYGYPNGLPSLPPPMPDRSYSYHHISNDSSYYDPRVPRQLPDHRQQQYHVPSIPNHIDPIDSFVSLPLLFDCAYSRTLTQQSTVPYGSGEKPGTFPF